MKKSEVHHSLEKCEKAFGQLKDAVQEASDGNQLKQDGVIQRFEFTFELLWKTLREYLAFLGKSINNPRDTLKESFREQIIADEQTFLDMLEDRNLSTHSYDFETTRRIFGHIQSKYVEAMQALLAELKKRISFPETPTGKEPQ